MKRTPLKRTPLKRSRKPAVPREIKDHWTRVANMGCLISGSRDSTIHHVHGGSIREFFGERCMPGTAQKQNDWLVIPIAERFHTGECGIDNGMGRFKGVAAWEEQFGTQLSMLERVRAVMLGKHGYDIYEKAGVLDDASTRVD